MRIVNFITEISIILLHYFETVYYLYNTAHEWVIPKQSSLSKGDCWYISEIKLP